MCALVGLGCCAADRHQGYENNTGDVFRFHDRPLLLGGVRCEKSINVSAADANQAVDYVPKGTRVCTERPARSSVAAALDRRVFIFGVREGKAHPAAFDLLHLLVDFALDATVTC